MCSSRRIINCSENTIYFVKERFKVYLQFCSVLRIIKWIILPKRDLEVIYCPVKFSETTSHLGLLGSCIVS